MDSHLRGCRSKKRWLILFGIFTVGFLDVGTIKSFGVLIETIAEDLQTSLSVIGLAIGLSHAVAQGFAVVTIPLLKRFSAGKLVIVGSSLAATGFCLIYFATSGIQFLLLMILTGFGFSVVFVPSQSSIIYYFPDHFEIATTIVVLGSGVGMMVLPLLTEQLFIAYNWRGAILILGALNFHICLTGLLMATSNEHVPKEPSPIQSQIVEETESLLNRTESVDKNSMDDDDDDDDDDDHDDHDGINKGLSCSVASAAKRLLLDTFDMKLFCDYPRFVTLCLAFFNFAVTYVGWIVFLIPNADAKGIRPDRAVLLATVGGTANIFGRLAVGLLAARFKVRPHIIYCLISILSAGAFFGNFFTKSFPMLGCLAAMNGFALGGNVICINLLCKDTVPDERFAASLSLASLIIGIGDALGSLFIGLVYDVTKSFDIVFCVLGAAKVLEACFIISPVIFDRMVTMVTKP